MEPIVLTWRPQNFLTIFLMVLVIGAVTALVAQGIRAVAPASQGS